MLPGALLGSLHRRRVACLPPCLPRPARAAFRHRSADGDGGLGAAALGEFAEGALLLSCSAWGTPWKSARWTRPQRHTSAGDLAPRTALTRRNGAERESPVEQLISTNGHRQAGARLPVDGEVTAGHASGESGAGDGGSPPVEKAPGSPVFAGTINGEGALEVRVTRLAKDSTLARVMRMVEEAQAQKSPTQQTVERVDAGLRARGADRGRAGDRRAAAVRRAVQRIIPAGHDAAGGSVAVARWRWALPPPCWRGWRRRRAAACW